MGSRYSENASNKAVQTDNLRAVCLVVSLSLHFTTRQTALKLRLTAALDSEIEKQLHAGLWFRSSVAGAIHVSCEDNYL